MNDIEFQYRTLLGHKILEFQDIWSVIDLLTNEMGMTVGRHLRLLLYQEINLNLKDKE